MRTSVVLIWLLCLTACQVKETATIGKRASIEEIESEIRAYIVNRTNSDGGYFIINENEKQYRMKLVRVHTEYLSSLGPGRNFACVDLAEAGGDVYDVDFFMEGEPGSMKVTETSVHKLNGKPFYAWRQKADKTWFRLPLKDADQGLLGVKEGADTFEFQYRFRLPELKGAGRIWIPIAESDRFQQVTVKSIDVPGRHRMIREQVHGNNVLFSSLSEAHSGDSGKIVYHVIRQERGPVPDSSEISSIHLNGHAMTPVGGRFAEIAGNAVKGRDKNDLMRARALYDYVIDNMKYMKYGDFGRGDSNYACDVKTGNCSEFHSYFISLARSIGIPARFAIGASIPSDRDEGGIDGYHCWAEFHAEGKWWPVDISEANKYTPLATYYFGHHPANRIELSRGRDLMLNPGPASGPINFLAYPLLEVSGKILPTRNVFSFQRIRTTD